MRESVIDVKPKLSKLWFLMVLIFGIIIINISVYFNSYIGILIITAYFIGLTFRPTNYKLLIDTKKDHFKIIINGKQYDAKFIKCKQVTFLLTIITLQYAKKIVNLPVYIDNIAIHKYKQLRMYLQWN